MRNRGHEGGQAIVGNVTQSHRDEGSKGVPAQPPALTHYKTRPMEIMESKEAVPAVARGNRKKNDRQSSTKYGSDVVEPEVRGQDPLRQAMPIACRAG